MPIPSIFWLAPIGSILALLFAWIFYRSMITTDPGSEDMQRIAGYVERGALAYLKRQYKIVLIVFAVVFVLFAFMAYVLKTQNG